MFLHIGGDIVIPVKDVIAIMDIDTTTISKDTREFLKILTILLMLQRNN